MACNACEDQKKEKGGLVAPIGEGCNGFEPHQWLQNRCLNCRHDKSKHTVIISDTPNNKHVKDRAIPNKLANSSKFRAYFSDGDENDLLPDVDLEEEESSSDSITPRSSKGKSSKSDSNKKGSGTRSNSFVVPPLPRKGSSSNNQLKAVAPTIRDRSTSGTYLPLCIFNSQLLFLSC